MPSDFKNINKYCLNCNKKLVLTATIHIKRKKFCSHSCLSIYNHKLGLIPNPPIKMCSNGKPREQKYCKECGVKISYKNEHGYCKLHFNKICKKTSVDIPCDNCGKTIQVEQARLNGFTNHFCDAKCHLEWKIKQPSKCKLTVNCSNCGDTITKFQSLINGRTNHFCSRKCQGEWLSISLRGKNGYGYIDGRTPFRIVLKGGKKYMDWRFSVYKRDGFKCVKCSNNDYLHAHHVKHFREILDGFMDKYKDIKDNEELLRLADNYEEFWDINNAMTLCCGCHQKEHPELKLTLGVN